MGVIPHIVTIIRWIARIWSILILALAVLVITTPDPYTVQPVPLAQQMLMGLFGVAILGSLIAWRWEGLGGAIAIASVVAHDVATRDFSGGGGVWSEVLTPASPLVFVFGFPGFLFLVCWALSRRKRG